MSLKENIKQRRLELNLTLEDVAKHLNVSKPTIQRYESGVIDNISFDKVEQLAEVLQVSPSWLMDWEYKLTAEEEKFIDQYKKLDDFGKHTVNVVLEMEVNRYKNK
jgi:transcriptional regulator with XRE-family HTH domain